jgi:hypothetical protein
MYKRKIQGNIIKKGGLMTENSKLLTIKEAVDWFLQRGIQRSSRTLYRWANDGRVFKRVHRIGLGGVLIPEAELERALREEDLSL